jgi:hypothetical protein
VDESSLGGAVDKRYSLGFTKNEPHSEAENNTERNGKWHPKIFHDDLLMNPTELAVFGTLGGAFIAGLFAAIAAIINKRSEEKRHFRELVVKTAAEHWRLVAEISTASKMPPLTTYIVHTVKMCDLALNTKLTAANIKPKLDEITALLDVMYEHSANVGKKS